MLRSVPCRGMRTTARSIGFGVAALVLWPLSYAWVPFAGQAPGLVLAIVPIAEIASLILALAAIVLGTQARRDGAGGREVAIGIGIGGLVVALIVGGAIIGLMLAG